MHERSVENDFLLLALRRRLLAEQAEQAQVLARNSTGTSVQSGPGAVYSSGLHIALMSATLDGDVLSSYFNSLGYDVPRVSFPGRTFPVEVPHHLITPPPTTRPPTTSSPHHSPPTR